MVKEFVQAYDIMRVHVVTAYGLSARCRQLEGVVHGGGGGVDPLFYIIYIQGVHNELRLRNMGPSVQGATRRYPTP